MASGSSRKKKGKLRKKKKKKNASTLSASASAGGHNPLEVSGIDQEQRIEERMIRSSERGTTNKNPTPFISPYESPPASRSVSSKRRQFLRLRQSAPMERYVLKYITKKEASVYYLYWRYNIFYLFIPIKICAPVEYRVFLST